MAKNKNGRNVAKTKYSEAERKSFFAGLFAGLNKSNKKPNVKTKYHAPVPNKSVKGKQIERKKWYSFLAFNDNGDVFNVEAYDSSRANALKQARSKLKRDPEIPCWGVSITEDAGNHEEYYRTVTVDDLVKGGVSDNWKRHYKNDDEHLREKYGKDLSKPLKK